MVKTLQWITVIFVLRHSACHHGLDNSMARHLYTRIFLPMSFPFNKNTGPQWKYIENHPGWKLLNSFECGENVADRIIGGLDAALGQFPWIVRLGYVSEDNETDWMCGGTLISDRHVVTAAHCVQTDPDGEFHLSFMRFGEYDTRTNPDCRLNVCAPTIQDRVVKPEHIKSHHQFNTPAFHNDIAVIKLAEPVKLNDYVIPICLPRKDQLDPLKVGELVTVAGWGKMNMSTDERASVLQYIAPAACLTLALHGKTAVEGPPFTGNQGRRIMLNHSYQLPVVEPAVCDSFGRGFKLAESEICAGAQKNKDACGGDSGGPLMKVFDTSEGPKNYLVGVVSFGPTICGIRKPGVYSSVSYFMKWILDSII